MPSPYDPTVMARHRRLLATPVIGSGNGGVYFGRDTMGQAVKIGFSNRPAERLNDLGLTGELIFLGCPLTLERALHRWFATERLAREFFRGPRVEAFIVDCGSTSTSTLNEHDAGSWFRHRLAAHEERLAYKSALRRKAA